MRFWYEANGTTWTEPWYGTDGQLDFLRWLIENNKKHGWFEMNGKVESEINGDLNLERLERKAIIAAMTESGGSQQKAAQFLGISPRSLNHKIHHVHKLPYGKKNHRSDLQVG